MKKHKFNSGWIFHEGSGGSLDILSGDTEMSHKVILPHDAAIEMVRNPNEPNGTGNGFFQEKTIYYTKSFTLNPSDRGKSVWFEFEGIYQNSFVYINNSFAGQHPYGYSNFYINATKYINFDKENVIKIVVKNGVPSGRWYTGGGIYRDINIMISERLHFIPDGIHLKTVEADRDLAVIHAESIIEYTGIGTKDVYIDLELKDADGRIAGKVSMPFTVEEYQTNKYLQKLYVTNPQLWSVESPYLYHYRVTITEDGRVLDEETGTFGIRILQLDPVYGLRINGESVKLRGGCIHHDNGIIGAAEFEHAADVRVKKLKEAGYNAIRSAHYPISRKLLSACDREGMLVMDELTDVWTRSKVDFDYSINMPQWWEKDVTQMVNKDYNHPCVIFYSIGNEIPETGNKFDLEWGKKIADKIRSLDDTRYTVNCVNLMLGCSEHMSEIFAESAETSCFSEELTGDNKEINSIMNNLDEITKMCISSKTAGKVSEAIFSQVDVAGYNYGTARYEIDSQDYPTRILVGSETYSKDLDINWNLVKKYPNLIGDFSWTAWDYLGETGIGAITYGETKKTGGFYADYPYKNANCGDFNLIGERRPVSYWKEIIWGFRKKPYIAVRPPMHYGEMRNITNWAMTDAVRSWNWQGYEGKEIEIEVYADADEAELYLNGRLIERKPVGKQKAYITKFNCIYEPGFLETVIYKNGKEIGRDGLCSAGGDRRIKAEADRETIPADGSDICYVLISIVDSKNILCPDAECKVSIKIDGPGIIQGYGSAAPDSVENYFDTEAKTYEGRLLAAIRGSGEKGTVILTFKTDEYEKTEVRIKTV